MKFLDEFAFEQESFRFTADDVIIKIVNTIDERAEFEIPSHSARRLKIGADAFAEVTGFADVDNRAEAIAHKVDPGFMRKFAKLLLDVIGQRHADNKLLVEGCWLQVEEAAFSNVKPRRFKT